MSISFLSKFVIVKMGRERFLKYNNKFEIISLKVSIGRKLRKELIMCMCGLK